MKKSILLSLAAVILLWIGCNNQADINSMFENPETRSQIISGLLDDHSMMTELMDSMMNHDHAQMMMKGHKGMLNMMMGASSMKDMMKDKPEMMHNMMSNIIKDGQMMGHMMQMMSQEGMISKECMQSCMKMMADKGIIMDMGMMRDTSEGTEKKGDKHDSHH